MFWISQETVVADVELQNCITIEEEEEESDDNIRTIHVISSSQTSFIHHHHSSFTVRLSWREKRHTWKQNNS